MVMAPLGVYSLAALAAAATDATAPARVACFDPANLDTMSAGRKAASLAMALSAVVFLFVVPGLLGTLAFTRRAGTRRNAHLWSLAVNSAALIVVCLLLRHTTGVQRGPLAVAWLAWTVVLFAFGWQPRRSPVLLGRWRRRYGGGLLVGLLAAAAAGWAMFPEQFVQCFAEDGTETYELARSLREHFLPYWELETWTPEGGNRLGTVVVNPSLINSYWTCGLQTLLGSGEHSGGELGTRLPYWVWWLAVFAVALRLVRPSRRGGSWTNGLILALLMILVSVLFSFYVGYNPYMADLANPGVPDALFTLCVLLAFDCLRRRDHWAFVVSMLLASLVLYAGPVMLAAVLAAAWVWRPIERREVLRWGVRTVELLLAIALGYLAWGWWEGSLEVWAHTADVEYVADYLSPFPRWKSAPLFFGYFLLLCGGVPALGLIWTFRRGRWERTVATAGLLYLAIVLLSGFKNIHYLGPLLPIPVVLLLAELERRNRAVPRREKKTPGSPDSWACWGSLGPVKTLAACSLIVCIVLCWPKARSTFTLTRELGARTTITTDSYLTAARWARLRLVLIEQGLVSWYYDAHTWAAYAQREAAPAALRPLVLTDGGTPAPGYRPVASRPVEGTQQVARLYARDEAAETWLRTRPTLRPVDRYPAIMRPLAKGPFSPHENLLSDLELLRWPW